MTLFERSRTAADASRDIIWQGNCNSTDQYSICKVTDQTADSTFALLRSTIAIEYPVSNCPAKSGAASFTRLYRKRCRGGVCGISVCGASDRVLAFTVSQDLPWATQEESGPFQRVTSQPIRLSRH